MSTLMKDFHKLLRRADKLYDGQVEFVMNDGEKVEVDENENEKAEDKLDVDFFVTPKEGLYKNARVKFNMCVYPSTYPYNAPEILCKNAIYHPNINVPSEDEPVVEICVNLLGSDWTPEVGLDGAVMAVLYLFYNPQMDDCLNRVCHEVDDYDQFLKNVKPSLRGGIIDGYRFDKLLMTETDEKDEVEKDAKDSTEVITPPPPTASVTNNDNPSEEIKEGAANIVSDDENSKTQEQVEDDANNNNDVTDTTTSTVATATITSINDDDASMDEKAGSVGAESGATSTPLAATSSAAETRNENYVFTTTHSTTENALSTNTDTATTSSRTTNSAIKLLYAKIKVRFSTFFNPSKTNS